MFWYQAHEVSCRSAESRRLVEIHQLSPSNNDNNNNKALYTHCSELLYQIVIQKRYLVFTMNQTHKFTHAVAVVIWWAECMLSNMPSRWKYHKIKQRNTGLIRWRGKHWTNNTSMDYYYRNSFTELNWNHFCFQYVYQCLWRDHRDRF